jgi:putative sterol carrier protein
MPDPTISEFIARMSAAFVPEKAAGVEGTIQLKLTGTQPGEWFIIIKDNQCTYNQGTVDAPRLTVAADFADFIKIFTGQLDGMQAFMQGRIRITGDMGLALKLLQLFKLQ